MSPAVKAWLRAHGKAVGPLGGAIGALRRAQVVTAQRRTEIARLGGQAYAANCRKRREQRAGISERPPA